MIYPKDFEAKIGFLPLREIISEFCETPMGKKLVDEMGFSSNRNEIINKLKMVKEMKEIMTSSILLPEDCFYDILPWVKETQAPGSFMSAERLYKCAVTFVAMKNILDFFSREGEDDSFKRFDVLRSEFSSFPEFDSLVTEIFRCIEKDGEIKDNASPALYEIRCEMDSVSKSMHKVMHKIMDESMRLGLIDRDVSPAMRDGHLVIPVSAANKKGISGILHDTSATGKTFFIEPAAVVEIGNRLRELEQKEQQEITAILIKLTSLISPDLKMITAGCNLLAKYDFIKAKARFAIETEGEMPIIEVEPEIDWFHAVHPGLLLSLRKHGREVVALNLNLNKEKRILIISGPNAGGKSVTLKTVGTVQYMMQCGLLPTLYSNSHMGIYRDVFIDIGDEQSMENDLSTYSSHLTNMKFFLQKASSRSLILADEIGSGTEPQIGAALAQAIIQQLGRNGCFGVITTHYQNLKVFAENEEGFVNGAMLYDRQHLRPTFQLAIGQPGSSFALEIAKNIGIQSSVLDSAKEIVGTDYVDSEKFLLDIQRDRKYWKKKRIDIKEKESRLNKILEEYEIAISELKEKRSQILKAAKEEAKDILSGANSQIERSIHEIRKSQADREKAKAVRKELDDYKKSLEISSNESQFLPDSLKPLKHKSRKKNIEKRNPEALISREFEKGDYVKMENGGVVGQIISIEGKKAEVAFGGLRMKVDINKLQLTKKPKEMLKNSVVGFTTNDCESRQRQLNFKQKLDVRGMRADEALQAVTYFIDDAIQFNIGKVMILHGTGHGVLREMIRNYLKSSPVVKNFYDEDVRFGGAGITIVELL